MIYLDYNASTPIDPAVREAMLPFLTDRHGNPSSGHAMGKSVRDAIENARDSVAALLGCAACEMVFTSGGTESNNLAIKGVTGRLQHRGRHVVTTAVEHPAVLTPCRYLQRQGYAVTVVGVDPYGRVDPRAVIEEIRPDTVLISVMLANNEVGTIQPVAEIAAAAREAGVLVHTDAAQACAKMETRVDRLGVDLLSIAGHKMYAPQGIGALYVRRGVELEPLHHGAAHQAGRRGGTEPAALIVALGQAAWLAMDHQSHAARLRQLRDRLHDGLTRRLGERVVLLGHREQRLANTLTVGFRGRIGADILAACPDICASTGAACHAGARERSGVLSAMDVPEEVAFGAIRFSVGRFTTEMQIDAAVEMIATAADNQHR